MKQKVKSDAKKQVLAAVEPVTKMAAASGKRRKVGSKGNPEGARGGE